MSTNTDSARELQVLAWPEEARDVVSSSETADCVANRYNVTLSKLICLVDQCFYREFPMSRLPQRIGKALNTDMGRATEISLELANSLLKHFNVYVDIGLTDDLIAEWRQSTSQPS